MDKPVELIPLVCMRCSTPIPARLDEAAWVCVQCGQGLALDGMGSLVPQAIKYSAGIPANATGKPFWVAEGRVALERETYSGDEARFSEMFWSQPRVFFIPAFTCEQETLLALGSQMLLEPPNLAEGPPAKFEAVTFLPEDTQALAEFIVAAVEASRKDMLKTLQYSVMLSEPVLWILPGATAGTG